MMLALGIFALVIVVGAVVAVIVMAGRQASENAPTSEPTDFVVPSSRGGYAWRKVDETPEQFHERVAREDAESSSGS